RGQTSMHQTPFTKYLNREGIFLERNLVISVRLVAITPLASDRGTGANFELFAIADLRTRSGQDVRLPFQLGTTFDVGSAWVKDCNEVLQASGYVNWVLVFNDQVQQRIRDHKELHADSRQARRIV